MWEYCAYVVHVEKWQSGGGAGLAGAHSVLEVASYLYNKVYN